MPARAVGANELGEQRTREQALRRPAGGEAPERRDVALVIGLAARAGGRRDGSIVERLLAIAQQVEHVDRLARRHGGFGGVEGFGGNRVDRHETSFAGWAGAAGRRRPRLTGPEAAPLVAARRP